MTRAAALTALLVLSACGGGRNDKPIGPKRAAVADWRQVATSADRARVRDARATWVAAVAAAKGKDGGAMARDPAFYAPDRAMTTGAMPPPGAYRCRVVKLGTRGGSAMPGFIAYPAFDCRIDDEGAVDSFYKVTGSQRPVGLLFPDGASRAVFLGTLVLGDETSALAYGRDASRDMAGLVTRIGPQRWRLALPQPRFESQLDLIELVPAG